MRYGRLRAVRPAVERTNPRRVPCAVWRTLEGQALELGWRRDGVVDLSAHDYLAMVLGKTCWYTTIAPLRVGA